MQWKKTDHVLKPEKVQRLTGLMDKAMKGVRRIAALFNRKKENKKSSVRVGKSWVHHILTIAGLTGKQKTAIDSKHLQRPQTIDHSIWIYLYSTENWKW